MQIGEQDFRDSIAATKKDAKLVTAAKNDRLSSAEGMYAEFARLPVERQRDIIISISNDYFVAANWKIAFPLNNVPAPLLPDMVKVAGKALFFTRDEDCVREEIRAVRLYQDSPFAKQIAACLADAAEIAGTASASVAQILTSPEIFGLIKTLEPSPDSEMIVSTIGKICAYTKNQESTMEAAKFLAARRYSPQISLLASLLENSIYLARDRKSVNAILTGFSAGGIDVVLQKNASNKAVISSIRDFAWKSRDWKAIRSFLQAQ